MGLKSIKSMVKQMLLKEQYENNLIQKQMKLNWYKAVIRQIKEEDPEVLKDPRFKGEADKLYSQGIPAPDAADAILQKPGDPIGVSVPNARATRLRAMPLENKVDNEE